MKFGPASQALLFLASAVTLSSGVWAEEETRLRGLQGKGNAYGKMRKPCTIVAIAELKIPGYESSGVRGLQSGSDPNGADEEFVCELDPDDAPNGHANQVVRFNLDESQKKKMHEGLYSGDLVSGSSTYYDPDAEVSSDEVSPGKGNGNGNAFGWTKNGKADDDRRLASTRANGENKKYLVVRVTDVDGKVYPHTADQMSDNVFGTNGDPNNLKSQAEACSYGKTTILPGGIHADKEAATGVVDVTINLSLESNDRYAVHNAVTAAVNTKLGISLPGPYDQVLYSVEKCYTTADACGWAAYAYINSWMSVYQDRYYYLTGVLMHELGHNWGMAHSGGLNGATYTDHTGLMGNPLYSDDVGRMCFNPAKNWYVGWYDDAKTLLDPSITSTWRENVVGIADYGNNPDNHSVVIKIETGTSTDYFIGFNRATGINSDNEEADNEVIIVETGNNGESYSQSFLKAHLIQGESYTFLNWKGTGEDLVITAKGINIFANPGYADIEVRLGAPCTANPDCDDGVYCNGAETCNAGECQPGTPVVCADDDLFCNGSEECSESAQGCVSQFSLPAGPCTAGQCEQDPICNEEASGYSCSTTPTATCCGDGICEVGEHCNNCSADCPKITIGGSDCGNSVCENGEDCYNCPSDCNGVTNGKPNRRYCCAGTQTGCSDSRCSDNDKTCDPDTPPPEIGCCGDGTCEAFESYETCNRAQECAPTPTQAPVPTTPGPTVAPTPAPTNGPINCPSSCIGDKWSCGSVAGCSYSNKNKACQGVPDCQADGGAEFCSGKGGYCSGDDDCCGSSNCKGNSRCS